VGRQQQEPPLMRDGNSHAPFALHLTFQRQSLSLVEARPRTSKGLAGTDAKKRPSAPARQNRGLHMAR
jgi:hypothetical protein